MSETDLQRAREELYGQISAKVNSSERIQCISTYDKLCVDETSHSEYITKLSNVKSKVQTAADDFSSGDSSFLGGGLRPGFIKNGTTYLSQLNKKGTDASTALGNAIDSVNIKLTEIQTEKIRYEGLINDFDDAIELLIKQLVNLGGSYAFSRKFSK